MCVLFITVVGVSNVEPVMPNEADISPETTSVPVRVKVDTLESNLKLSEPEISPVIGVSFLNWIEYSGPSATSIALAVIPVNPLPSP